MEKLKKWAWGICLILGGICGFVIAGLDKDDTTKPDVKEAIKKVQEGIEVIRKEELKTETPAPAPVPEEKPAP